jgi:hypothetical protein
VANRSRRSFASFVDDFVSDILSAHFACAKKLRHRKETKQYGNANRQRDQPVRHVACPRANGGIEPGQRHNRKQRPSHFVEKLLQNPPEPAKTRLLRNWLPYATQCAHGNILAQNQERNVLPNTEKRRTFVDKGL